MADEKSALRAASANGHRNGGAEGPDPGRLISGGETGWLLGSWRSPEGRLLAPLALVLAVSPYLDGFYAVSWWGPLALAAAVLMIALLVARPRIPNPAAGAVLAGLLALWLWSALSTRWAESADQAALDADRWFLYVAVFAICGLLLREDRLGVFVCALCAAGSVALGVYIELRLLTGSGGDLFLGGRLHDPLGYFNGQACYLLLGVWPLVALAERSRGELVGGTAVAGATLLAGLVLLSQTRSAAIAAVASLVVVFALVPGRQRRLLVILTIAAATAASAPILLDVYSDAGAGVRAADVTRAGGALLLSALGAGAAWALGQRLLGAAQLPAAVRAIPVGLAVLLGMTALALGDPTDRVDRLYDEFVELDTGVDRPDGASRFASGAGNRHDYWRVAIVQFREHPWRGLGAGNYDRTYFVERRTNEDIRQPHSLELQVLAELGLVGGTAVALLLGGMLFALWRRARGSAPYDRLLAVAAGGIVVVWAVQTSVDWMHLLPGITGVALAAGAVLIGPWRPALRDGPRGRGLVVAACAALALFGVVVCGREVLADRALTQARETTDVDDTISSARQSLAYNDEKVATYHVLAAAYARRDDYRRARLVLQEAVRREPHDFVSWALLGDLATRRGEVADARFYYRRASGLNPRDRGLAELAASP